MLMRLVDFLKQHGITALLTSLTGGGQAQEQTEVAISSIIDTWLLVQEHRGQRRAQPRAVRAQVAAAWPTPTRSASS